MAKDDFELIEGNPIPDDYSGTTDDQPKASNALVDYVVSRFDYFKRIRLPLEKKWDSYYRTWRCIEDADDKTRNHERCKIKVPASKEAVNNAVDSIFQIVLAYPWFDVQPPPMDMAGKTPEEISASLALKHEQAKTIRSYLRYLHDRENIESKIHNVITDFSVYGTTVSQVVAKSVTNTKVKRTTTITPLTDPTTGEVMDQIPTEETSRTEQKVNHPELEHIPLENFYIDTNALGVQRWENCDGFVKRGYHKKFELLENPAYDKEAINELSRPMSPEVKAGRFSRNGLSLELHDDDVELLEWWGWIPNSVLLDAGMEESDVGGKEMTVIVANRQLQLLADPNPHVSGERPFLVARYEKVPGEFYGIGIVEIAAGPQKALDATVRSRIDNKALSLNQIFGINTDKFIPGQTLSLYPGKALLFRGDPRESFFPLMVPDVTQSSYADAQEYERYIQSAHGISRVIGGMPAKQGEQTATEVSMLVNQSNSRIKTLVKSFENDFIKPMLKWYVRIILQFINDKELYHVTDNETGAITLHQITPNDVTEDFDFVVLGSVALNAQAQAQKRMQFLQMTSNPIDAPFINRRYQIQKIYESFNFDDEEVALLTAPPPEQAAIMAQAAGGPGVASQPGAPNGPTQTGAPMQPSGVPGVT